ncbi:MAG: TrkA family potassium uptake protein, partial [candidate division WOR-3 bacterium]
KVMYIIITGIGKVGYNLAKSLMLEGHEVALIEKDRQRFQELFDEFGENVIYGDASDSFTLQQAGTNRCDLLVACSGRDEDNLVICEVAKALYMVPRTLARVNDPKNEALFTKLGIDQTVNTTNMISALIGHKMGTSFLTELVSFHNAEIVQIEVPEGSPVSGSQVKELKLPRDTLLIAAIRSDQVLILRGESQLQPGDTVIALTTKTGEEELRSIF